MNASEAFEYMKATNNNVSIAGVPDVQFEMTAKSILTGFHGDARAVTILQIQTYNEFLVHHRDENKFVECPVTS